MSQIIDSDIDGFVHWVNVSKCLETAMTSGITRIMIFQLEGDLLAHVCSDQHASASPAAADQSPHPGAGPSTTGIGLSIGIGFGADATEGQGYTNEVRVTPQSQGEINSSLLSALWRERRSLFQDDSMNAMHFECDNGQVLVASLGMFLIAIEAQADMGIGLLNGKLESLLAQLEPLNDLFRKEP